jgi:septum site-determining protein MinC
MTSEPTAPINEPKPKSDPSSSELYSQVHLKRAGKKLLLILPQTETKDPANEWIQLLQDLKYCLNHHKGTWTGGTELHLLAQNRLLDNRQLRSIIEALESVELRLTRVCTSRRQTAVVAATAGYSVEQETIKHNLLSQEDPSQPFLAEPLYMKTTIRSGVAIRHPGTVIIQGDINPGGEIIADGDILIWGSLRGIAHAGANGNLECCIMALRMQPTQLRIADSVARAPSVTPEIIEPEVAYMTSEGIRLQSALNFGKIHMFDLQGKGWIEKNQI